MEIEMDKLIAEATQALNDLVKSEQSAYEQELKKSQGAQAPATSQPAAPAPASTPAAQAAPAAQPAAPEVKKNESSSSSSSSSSAKKAEDSGYENMSPEASGGSSSSSSSAPASGSSATPAPAPEASGSSSSSSGSPSSSSGSSSGSSDSSSGSSSGSSGSSDGSSSSDSSGSGDEDHIGQMLSELDDDRLQHLYMKAKAELMARMHRDESPSQPQEQPVDQNAVAMSEKKVKELEDKLAKAQADNENLKKATGALIDLTEKFTRKPVKKAVTDVKFIERGGENLTKTETMSDGELKKHINDISKDYSKLSKFSSEERMTLMDYCAGRKPRTEAVKILSK